MTVSAALHGENVATPAFEKIVNGDFSQPAIGEGARKGTPTPVMWDYWAGIPGWAATTGSNVELQTRWPEHPVSIYGQYCELKAEPKGNYGITQLVGTASDKTYLLALDYAARPDVVAVESNFDIVINGVITKSKPYTATNQWSTQYVLFHPPTKKSTISLIPNDNAALDTTGCLVDNVRINPVEVVEVAPMVSDESGIIIFGSSYPSTSRPLTPFVELDPVANKIAHRELKVKIGDALNGKKVTWTLGPVPGATPATIRGSWTNSKTHPDRFEASTTYGANGFKKLSQASGTTTVATDGFTAIRVNVPPIGFNQVRITIQIEGYTTPIVLIDMEVPAVVVIDPGHGGLEKDTLPSSSWNNAVSPSKKYEKDMTLAYGLELRNSLRAIRKQDKLNLWVFMTREADKNLSAAARAHVARDNGADVLFVLHFNSNDNGTKPHQSRGTLEVYRVTSNVHPEEDTELSSNLIDRMVGAMSPFDARANHRARVNYEVKDENGKLLVGPGVSSDLNNGNTEKYHPIRTGYIEGEFIDFGANTPSDQTDDAVDILLNTGPNAAPVKTATVNAIRDGIIQDMRVQPHE